MSGTALRDRAGRLAMAVLALWTGACVPDHPRRVEAPQVGAWLNCEECSESELETLTALGDAVVGSLRRFLVGPPAEHLSNIGVQAAANWRAFRSRRDSVEYVDAEVANYAAVIQTRAAVALGRIGTSGAVGLLTVALDPGFTPRVPYRPDVREALRRALRAALDRRGAGRPAIRP